MNVCKLKVCYNENCCNKNDRLLLFLGYCYNDNQYYKIESCNKYIHSRKYESFITFEEWSFSLAYSILMYKDICQFERFLQAVWRPSNIYCIHLDADASPQIVHNVREIIKCFPNAFISTPTIDVEWGTPSVLEADLICMNNLVKITKPYWLYFLNANIHEFPLKTNLETVRILKILNGGNSIDTKIKFHHRLGRFRPHFDFPPVPLDPWFGEFHVVACRGFAEYIINSGPGQKISRWALKEWKICDEGLYSTLNYNPHLRVPGAYTGKVEGQKYSPFFHRFKQWKFEPCPSGAFECTKCESRRLIRNICIIGIRDLKRITDLRNPALILNKIYWNIEPHAFDCLEEWFHNRVRDEKIGNKLHVENKNSVNYSFYASLDVVEKHVPCFPFQPPAPPRMHHQRKAV